MQIAVWGCFASTVDKEEEEEKRKGMKKKPQNAGEDNNE